MIRGFDIFKTREKFLNVNNSSLPPCYNLFYSTFEIGINKMVIPGVFLEQAQQIAGLLEQKINSDVDFVVYDFLSIEESNIFIKNMYEDEEDILGNYFPIAECDSNKSLLVGVNDLNKDQIFIENRNLFSDGERIKFIAKNIFEFVTRISYVELNSIGYGIRGYSQLYKNWYDSEWRIEKNINQ